MAGEILEMTLAQASKNLGVNRETLHQRLGRHGIKGKKKGARDYYTIKQINTAWYGDKEAEQTREISARADIAELEYRRKCGELVDRESVKSEVSKWLSIARQAIEQSRLTKPEQRKILNRLKEPTI